MLALLEALTWWTVAILLVTQIVVPAWKDEPFWPLFRWRRRKLHNEIKEVTAQLGDAELEQELEKVRARADRKARKPNANA